MNFPEVRRRWASSDVPSTKTVRRAEQNLRRAGYDAAQPSLVMGYVAIDIEADETLLKSAAVMKAPASACLRNNPSSRAGPLLLQHRQPHCA